MVSQPRKQVFDIDSVFEREPRDGRRVANRVEMVVVQDRDDETGFVVDHLDPRLSQLAPSADGGNRSVFDEKAVRPVVAEDATGPYKLSPHVTWGGSDIWTAATRSSWIGPLLATTPGSPNRKRSPRWFVTLPPASVTNKIPAAASQGCSPNSQ